jgi:hypothetical protein
LRGASVVHTVAAHDGRAELKSHANGRRPGNGWTF